MNLWQLLRRCAPLSPTQNDELSGWTADSRSVSQSVSLLPLGSQKTHPSSADSWFIYRSLSARFPQENVFICFGATDRSRRRRRHRCSSSSGSMQTGWFRSLKRSEPVFSWLPALSFVFFLLFFCFSCEKPRRAASNDLRLRPSASPNTRHCDCRRFKWKKGESIQDSLYLESPPLCTFSEKQELKGVLERPRPFLWWSRACREAEGFFCFVFLLPLFNQTEIQFERYRISTWKVVEQSVGWGNRWRRELGEIIWGNDDICVMTELKLLNSSLI